MEEAIRFYKKLLYWFLMNIAASLIIFSFLSVSTTIPLLTYLAAVLIVVNIIATIVEIAGFSGFFYYRKYLPSIELLLSLATTLGAAVIGILISHKITVKIFIYPVFPLQFSVITATLICVAVLSMITRQIVLSRDRHSELSRKIDDFINGIKTIYHGKTFISIKEDEKIHEIKLANLIYLSSHGKRTTLHTKDGEFITNQLIKEIENKLSSEDFMRIHKQFIINLKFLSRMKYYKQGKYFVYLNDEDETTLPVGRNIAPLLKEKLGIIQA
jgi:DNA-binding LytR/AlgR family response regulator